jgi:hypothetical protein
LLGRFADFLSANLHAPLEISFFAGEAFLALAHSLFNSRREFPEKQSIDSCDDFFAASRRRKLKGGVGIKEVEPSKVVAELVSLAIISTIPSEVTRPVACGAGFRATLRLILADELNAELCPGWPSAPLSTITATNAQFNSFK